MTFDKRSTHPYAHRLLALAQNAKITPTGSYLGELSANDRAFVFGDLTGVCPE